MKTSILDQQTSTLSGLSTKQHPIIRLFCRGVRKDQKCSSVLIDVHGFYPYFFCQIPDDIAAKIINPDKFRLELAGQLEMLTHETFPKINHKIRSVIHDILLVKAIPFNGYHKTKRLFAKILVSEQFVLHPVIQTIRQASAFSKYLIFESNITTFSKFINDCKIDITRPIKCSSCISRTSQIGNKISTCDYEYDVHFSLITQDLNENTQIHYQVDTQKQQNIKQQLQEIYLQRIALRNSQQFSSILADVSNKDENDSIELSDSDNNYEQKQEEHSQSDHNLETDVNWFEKQFDGMNPGNTIEMQPSNEVIKAQITSSVYNINRPFTKLRYSNANDIPDEPLVHLGKVFDWKQQQQQDNLSANTIYQQDILNNTINDLITDQYDCKLINDQPYEVINQMQDNTTSLSHIISSPSMSSPVLPQTQFQGFNTEFNKIKQDVENLLFKYERLSYIYKVSHIEVSQLDMFVVVQSFALYGGSIIDMMGDDQSQPMSQSQELSNTSSSEYQKMQRLSRFDIFINTDKVPSNQIDDAKDVIYNIMKRIANLQDNNLAEHVTQYNSQYRVQFNNIFFECCSLREILTIKLPECIHMLDPDFISSYSNEYAGLGRLIQLGFLLYNINLMKLLSRQIDSNQIQKIQVYKNSEKMEKAIGEHLLTYGTYAAKLSINGRIILSMQLYYQDKMKSVDYRLSTMMKKFNIEEFYSAKQHKQIYLQAMQLSKPKKQSDTLNSQEEGYFDIKFNKKYDIPCYGDQTRLKQSDMGIEVIAYTLHATHLLLSSNIITSIHYSAGINNITIKDELSRGSQYKVEQLLLKQARQNDFLLGPIPTPAQISTMKPNSITPIIFEPQSRFKDFPMLVFDFASLYPSIISGFNLCYSTILCNFEKKQKIGAVPIDFLQQDFQDVAQDDLFKSPMNCLFLKQHIRRGIIPTTVDIALAARKKINKEIQLIKQQKIKLFEIKKEVQSRKYQKQQKIQKIDIEQLNELISKLDIMHYSLDGKQYSYKIFLNTIYGYTAGQFSGNMPCQFIGDTVIDISNKLVMYCIKIIERDYQCNVVYVDTDSLFVDTTKYFAEKTNQSRLSMLQESIKLGTEILNKLNSMFQQPIQLKFEKIYFPSLLFTKKKYAGLCYDYEIVANMSAKELQNLQLQMNIVGLEQMKKDIPLVSKYFLYKTLEILFITQDLSQLQQFIILYIIRFALETIDIQHYTFNRTTNKSININKIINEIYQQKDPQADHVQFIVIKGQTDDRKAVTASKFVHLRDIWQLNEKGLNRYQIYYLYYLQRLMIDVAKNIYATCGYDIFAALSQISHFLLENQQQLLQNYVADTEKFQQVLQYFIRQQIVKYNYNKEYIYKLFHLLNMKLSQPIILPSVETVVRIPMFSSYVKSVKLQEIKSPSKQCFLCSSIQTSTIQNGYICDKCIKNYSKGKAMFQYMRVKKLLYQKIRQFNNRHEYCVKCSLIKNIVCSNYQCSVFHQKNKLRSDIIILSNQLTYIKTLLNANNQYLQQSQSTDIEVLESTSVKSQYDIEDYNDNEYKQKMEIIDLSD